MSQADRQFDELESLIAAVIDGQITPEQHKRLAAILREDAAARKQYVELIAMHSLLRQTLGGYAIKQARALSVLADIAEAQRLRPVEIPDAGHHPGKAKQRRMRLSPAKKAAALFVILGGVAAAIALAMLASNPSPEAVAAMTQSHEAQWQDAQGGAVVIDEGTPLFPQTLYLRQGLAKVTFRDGAVVVLDARQHPARFELRGRAEAVLHTGRVTVTAEGESEKGFVINLRDERAVMQVDTQLGIDVDPDGAARMHVLTGDVELRPRTEGSRVPPRWMRQGEAVALSGTSAVQEIAAQSTGFAPFNRTVRLESPAMPTAEGGKGAPVTNPPQGTSAAAGALARYLFQRDDAAETRLADSGPGARDGTISGATWTDGRRGGKNALLFGRPADRVSINIPGSFASLSFVAWVRVDRIANKYAALLLTDGFETGEVHWQISNEGQLEFSVKYASKAGNDYYSPVIAPLLRNEWAQVATVYDAARDRVTFYVNGVEAGSERIRDRQTLEIGSAQIGNWAGLAGKPPERREFNGAIGEMAVYDGALTAGEIERMYAESSR